MPNVLSNAWSKLVVRWKEASWWEKFIIINVIYPWTPTIVYLSSLYGHVVVDRIEQVPGGAMLIDAAVDAVLIGSYLIAQVL